MPASNEKLVLKSKIVNQAIKRDEVTGSLAIEDDPSQLQKFEVAQGKRAGHHTQRYTFACCHIQTLALKLLYPRWKIESQHRVTLFPGLEALEPQKVHSHTNPFLNNLSHVEIPGLKLYHLRNKGGDTKPCKVVPSQKQRGRHQALVPDERGVSWSCLKQRA